MLIRALGETDRLLEELTAGEVDTVTDRDGRSFVLQRAQERWRQAGAEKQAAIVDALPAHVVLLDVHGSIVSTNRSWRRFAELNDLKSPDYGVGCNYLTICDRAADQEDGDPARVAAGVRAVLNGANDYFTYEYACHGPATSAWYQLSVTPMDSKSLKGAVVMHVDITARKHSEQDLRRFAVAMDASPDGIILIDREDMCFVQINAAACRMHNLTREEVMLLNPWEVLHGSREVLANVYDKLIENGGTSEPEELHWLRRTGEPLWIEVRRHAQLIANRWTIVVQIRDVGARKEAEQQIAYLNRIYAVLSGINALIVRARTRDELFKEACRIVVEQGALAMTWMGMVDAQQHKVVFSASAGMDEELLTQITHRLNSSSDSSPGGSLRNLIVGDGKPFVSNDSQNDPRNFFGDMHTSRGIHSFAIFPLVVAEQAVGVIVLYARERGFFHEQQLRLLTDLAGDVAFGLEQIGRKERLDYIAYYDVLTGLANRHLFIERVAQYQRSAATANGRIAVCFIDLERFKNINYSLGRPAGDALLRQVAQWLTMVTGDANLVARIDADRFAIVLPDITDKEHVGRLVETALKKFLSHSFQLDGTTYRLAAKVGIALYPDDGMDADALIKHAEAALRKAKAGGDSHLFYAQKMTETVLSHLDLENRLRRALELDEYVLYYQPKVDVATGLLVGAEALIRWNDPAHGLVSPAQFIPILEETGLIHGVGRWALNQAMRDYLRWRDAGLQVVPVAVNLSALQLRNRNFISEVRETVGAVPGAAAGLELEITESLIMENVALSIDTLQAIRDMGVSLAIDDFGTGFSSLSYLSKLPVDKVKIDRSFIMDMGSPEGLSLVSIIINLAHSLKLKVVAEGVETVEQARALRSLKCDEMQGFLMSKPLPGAMFAEKYLTFRGQRESAAFAPPTIEYPPPSAG